MVIVGLPPTLLHVITVREEQGRALARRAFSNDEVREVLPPAKLRTAIGKVLAPIEVVEQIYAAETLTRASTKSKGAIPVKLVAHCRRT